MDTPAFLTVSQVAALLQLARTEVYKLVQTGQLPALRVGRAIRIPRDELTQWVKTRLQQKSA